MTSRLDDPVRLEALRASGLLRRTTDQRLSHLVLVATVTLETVASELNMITADRQVYIATNPHPNPGEVGLGQSACRLVIEASEPVAVPDVLHHPVLCNFDIVKRGLFRAYLGVPIYYDGQPIGSLCTLDDQPRDWSTFDIVALNGLARLAGLSVQDDPVP